MTEGSFRCEVRIQSNILIFISRFQTTKINSSSFYNYPTNVDKNASIKLYLRYKTRLITRSKHWTRR